MGLNKETGLLRNARYIASPNCDQRINCSEPEVIIIHCISLPPGEYDSESVIDFFTNTLNPEEHEYFQDIAHLKVSSHFYIRRNGDFLRCSWQIAAVS